MDRLELLSKYFGIPLTHSGAKLIDARIGDPCTGNLIEAKYISPGPINSIEVKAVSTSSLYNDAESGWRPQ